ncbi:hypothetical protein PG994_003923 [Apiospora phragmitis]|uniref:Uncharacterized protein n=1 Tax=Apiospora phragmitis TaxID=2905665 RepID=A0ABR1VZG3_9PEZI
MCGSTNGGSNGDVQHSAAAGVGHANTASGPKAGTPKEYCRFRMRTVDECYKSRLYASALEYYLLARPNLSSGSREIRVPRMQYDGDIPHDLQEAVLMATLQTQQQSHEVPSGLCRSDQALD